MQKEHVESSAGVRGLWILVGVILASVFAATVTLLFCQAFVAH